MRMLGSLKLIKKRHVLTVASSTARTTGQSAGLLSVWGHRVALLALCSPYLQGGVQKCIDFSGAMSEMHHFGLHPAAGIAVLVIGLELGGSAMILSGFFRQAAALGLALFTVAATFLANRYWELPDSTRLAMANSFYEHIGLAGALLLVAWHDGQQVDYAP